MEILASFLIALLGAQDPKSPVPSAADQKRLEKEYRNLFKDDYAKRDRDGKEALATKLLNQAAEIKNDPSSRYVLLREAKDNAAEAGAVDAAFAALNKLADSFEVKIDDLRNAVLADIRKSAASPEDASRVAESLLVLAKDSASSEQFEFSLKVAKEVEFLAKKTKELGMVNEALDLEKEVPLLKAEKAEVAKAELVVAVNPEDPEGHLTIGRYLCRTTKGFAEGIAHLSKSGDAGFREIAKLEAGNPKGPDALAAVGEAWLAVADKEKNLAFKRRYQLRGVTLLNQAMNEAAGLARARLEKRIRDLGPKETVMGVDLLKGVDIKKNSLSGEWKLTPEGLTGSASAGPTLAKIQIPCMFTEEYDLTLSVERTQGLGFLFIGLVGKAKPFIVDLDDLGGTKSGIGFINNQDAWANETNVAAQVFATPGPKVIVCSIRKEKIQVRLDGKVLIDWKANYDSLSSSAAWMPKDKNHLSIGLQGGTTFRILKLTLGGK